MKWTMQSRISRILFLLCILTSVIFSFEYTWTYREGNYFYIEGHLVRIDSIAITSASNAKGCYISSSSVHLTHPATLVGTTGSTLHQTESIFFPVAESGSGTTVGVTLAVASIDANLGEFCGVITSSKNVTLRVTVPDTTYSCSDSDGSSSNPYGVAGTVTSNLVTVTYVRGSGFGSDIDLRATGQGTGGSNTTADTCLNATYLRESGCSSGHLLTYVGITASTNYLCSAGRFILGDPVCSDPDGADISIQGTTTTSREKEGVSRITGTFTDYCINSTVVREHTCTGAYLSYTDYLCASGYTCTSGTGRCTATAAPPPPPPPPPGPMVPTVDLKANGVDGPLSVANGSTIMLAWTTTNSPTSCVASGDWSGTAGGAPGSDSLVVTGPRTYSYTFTCSNAAGSSSDTVTVNALAPAPPPPPPANESNATSPGPAPVPAPPPTVGSGLETFCDDHDSGLDLEHRTEVVWGIRNITSGAITERNQANDDCSGDDVREYFCNGDSGDSKILACPEGQTCSSGVCATLGTPAPTPLPAPSPTPAPAPVPAPAPTPPGPTTHGDWQLARTAIQEAEGTIGEAEQAGQNVKDAQQLLTEAQTAFNEGGYSDAYVYATQAQQIAAQRIPHPSPPPAEGPSLWMWLAGGIVGILILGLAAWMYIRGRKKTTGVDSTTGTASPSDGPAAVSPKRETIPTEKAPMEKS